MAEHLLRLRLDDEIPEHALILQRLHGMSGMRIAEFLRTHLYTSIMLIEGATLSVDDRAQDVRGRLGGRDRGDPLPRNARRPSQKKPPEPAPKPAFGAFPNV